MRIETLQHIKSSSGDKEVQILVFDNGLRIAPRAIGALGSFGKVTVALGSYLELSNIASKFLGDKRFNCVLASRVPLKEYDIIISDRATPQAVEAVAYYKPKYFLCFYPNGDRGCFFRSEEYSEFEPGCFKLKMLIEATKKKEAQAIEVEEASPVSEDKIDKAIEESDAVDKKDFETYLQSSPMTSNSYDPHFLKYIYEQVPGRVSIILVVTGKYTRVTGMIAAIKAQKLDDFEIVLIDNFSGFRTNFKSALRYTAREVDPEYAKWRARELTTGEYIFILDQDSEVPDFREEILKGKYCVR